VSPHASPPYTLAAWCLGTLRANGVHGFPGESGWHEGWLGYFSVTCTTEPAARFVMLMLAPWTRSFAWIDVLHERYPGRVEHVPPRDHTEVTA
jgi:hypothetical protein